VVVQAAESHAHVAPVLGGLQKINNKRGFEEAREEMHVLGELLGWRREWLAGACGWNESERASESRAKEDQRSEIRDQRSEQEQERVETKKVRWWCFCFEDAL
jgi:hypothetical protein